MNSSEFYICGHKSLTEISSYIGMLTRLTSFRGINAFDPANTSLRKSLFLYIRLVRFAVYLHHILRWEVELEVVTEVTYEIAFCRELAKELVWHHSTLL